MIEFKPITIEDKRLLESYTLSSSIQNCDLSFANMFCWQPAFDTCWAVVEGFLIIRFRIDAGAHLGYMQPIGKGGDLDSAHLVPIMAQDAHSNGERLTIIGLNEQGCQSLRRAHGDSFAFHSDRNFEDYIYLRHDLTTLSGRRYQPKRNHFNRFEVRYNYEYRPLTPDLFDGCRALERVWRESQKGSNVDNTHEQQALERAFANYDKLDLLGGAILVDGEVIAFSYGSAINDSTFCIHIEKANTNFDGAYTAINRLFAESLPSQFDHINREEDLGIEGLRRSKLSYHPTKLEPKFNAIYLHYDESECKKLWATVFHDDTDYIDEFIMKHYSRNSMLTVVTPDNRYVGMLHIINFDSAIGRCAYIFGVGTHPDFRHQGYATKLMDAAIGRVTQNSSYAAALLIPSNDDLRKFYSRWGFRGAINLRFQSYNDFDFGSGEQHNDIAMILTIGEPLELPCDDLILYK